MNQLIRTGIAWLLLVIAQVVIFQALGIGSYAKPFPFILAILMLPFEVSMPFLLIGAFSTGLLVDILGDTHAVGLHAFSLTLMAGLRNWWVPVVSSSTYRSLDEIDVRSQRITWYAAYAFPLILIHHIAYFLLDGRGTYLGTSLLQALASSGYTFLVCIMLIVIFFQKR